MNEANLQSSPSLDALDRDRAASLADEGGISGAKVEGLATPAFDDSGETPALPARLRPAGRKRGVTR